MKISLIIAAYNAENYIERCLHSLLPFSSSNEFEIILVNDGSKDSTADLIDNFLKLNKFENLTVINKQNGGLSSARNAGLEKVSGDYVLFLDSDDYILSDGLLKITPELQKDWDIVICPPKLKYEAFDNFKNFDDEYFSLKYKGLKKVSQIDLFSVPVVAWSKIYKTKFLKKLNLSFPEGLLYEDNYWYWLYMKNIDSVYFSDIPFYVYVRRNNSIMSNTLKKKEGHSIQRIEVLKRILDDCPQLTILERKRLLIDFLRAAEYDTPQKERFKLFYLMQEFLKRIPSNELNSYFLDVKNCNFIIERNGEGPACSLSLRKHFIKSLRRRIYNLISRNSIK